MSDILRRWTTWVGIAVALQVALVAPYFGDTRTTSYGFSELVYIVIQEAVIVGGCMFRAGMLYPRQSGGAKQ
jgi:hypothetical protein